MSLQATQLLVNVFFDSTKNDNAEFPKLPQRVCYDGEQIRSLANGELVQPSITQ